MRDKGGHRVVKVGPTVRPECLVENTTLDLFIMHDREKPDYPSDGIISFTRGKY